MPRQLIFGRKLSVIALALGVAVISAGVAFYALRGPDAGASQAQDFGDAVAARIGSDSETAATVNGIPISMGKVKAYMVFSSTNKSLGEAKADLSVPDFVNVLIANELLFQEAQRRKLVPTDAEAQAYATQNKTGLLELMKKDTPEAKNLRGLFAQVEGTPYGIDAYDSGLMLDGFRRARASSTKGCSIRGRSGWRKRQCKAVQPIG